MISTLIPVLSMTISMTLMRWPLVVLGRCLPIARSWSMNSYDGTIGCRIYQSIISTGQPMNGQQRSMGVGQWETTAWLRRYRCADALRWCGYWRWWQRTPSWFARTRTNPCMQVSTTFDVVMSNQMPEHTSKNGKLYWQFDGLRERHAKSSGKKRTGTKVDDCKIVRIEQPVQKPLFEYCCGTVWICICVWIAWWAWWLWTIRCWQSESCWWVDWLVWVLDWFK